jgi:glutamate synthase (NADPH/NADH) small chain
MPARIEEVHHAREEGIEFMLLTNPVEVIGKDGWVTGVRCIRMGLGEPDKSGRRRPVPIPGSEFEIPIDTLIVAIGQSPNPLIRQTTEGLKTEPWGGIYAGGDAVTGAATVILAMGAGKKAAAAIDRYLKGK